MCFGHYFVQVCTLLHPLVFVHKVHLCICRVHVCSYICIHHLELKWIMLKLRSEIVIMHECLSPGVNVKGRLPSPAHSAKPETSYWLIMSYLDSFAINTGESSIGYCTLCI